MRLLADPERWARLVRSLDERIADCTALPLQVPTSDRVLVDPFTGRRVLLSPGRAARPRTTGGSKGGPNDPYGEGRTPPTLFYATAADSPADLVVERETQTLELVREAAAGAVGGGSPWDSVAALAGARRVDLSGAEVPVVFPPRAWMTRAFLNLAPIIAHPRSGANGFVIAVHPEHEGGDLWAPDPPARTTLPIEVVDAVVRSWGLLQSWADSRGLLSVPFVNGGKAAASGQSLSAFHAQFYALDPESAGPVNDRESRVWGEADCPLCALIRTGATEVDRVDGVGLYAHPAPEIECTLLATPLDHVGSLADLSELRGFSAALVRGVRALGRLLGPDTPYNIVMRSGVGVRHLSALIIPRSGVPVPGGFEKATGLWVSTRDPAQVAGWLRGEGAQGRDGR